MVAISIVDCTTFNPVGFVNAVGLKCISFLSEIFEGKEDEEDGAVMFWAHCLLVLVLFPSKYLTVVNNVGLKEEI